MASDIAGTAGIRGSIPLSHALVPAAVQPARSPAAMDGVRTSETPNAAGPTGFGRSGLDLRDVLTDNDSVIARTANARVEVATGLEAARGALVRDQAADALVLLDEVWDAARHTEQGWYLRAGAFALLGLPGEAIRLTTDALALRPSSTALYYLRSLARLALADVAGAREALMRALALAPDDVVLVAQHAVLMSRQGDDAASESLLRRAASLSPEHPALLYARAAIRAGKADVLRWGARGNNARVEVGIEVSGQSGDATHPSDAIDEQRVHAANETVESTDTGLDPLDSALERLGSRIPRIGRDDAVNETRQLLRALAPGGALTTAVAPDRAHAARGLLATLTGVLRETQREGSSLQEADPLKGVLRTVVRALERDEYRQLQHVARRAASMLREPQGTLLLALAGRGARARDGSTPLSIDVSTPAGSQPAVKTPLERSLIAPVRHGLSLLDERDPIPQSVLTPFRTTSADTSSFDGNVGSVTAARLLTPHYAQPGWDAPSLVQSSVSESGGGGRIAAVLCVLAAFAAIAFGHPAIAVAFAGGASWLALRRSHRINDTAEYTSVK